MDRVAHLVALADPDHVAEVVGDDAEMVAVVLDVGRKEGAVAPPEHHLLAVVGGLPIHFHVQLVRLDQPGRLGQSLADLRQEKNEPVGAGSIAQQHRVRLHRGSLVHRPAHQRERLGRVPALRRERRRAGRQQRADRAKAPQHSHREPLTTRESMAGIFRGLWGRASWLCLAVAACGGARSPAGKDKTPAAETRTIPLAEAIVLETSGPPPSDTVVTFTAGEPRVIVVRHGPPESIAFAELELPRRGLRGAGARGAGGGAAAPRRVRAGRRHQPPGSRQRHHRVQVCPVLRRPEPGAHGVTAPTSPTSVRSRSAGCGGLKAWWPCSPRRVPSRTCSRRRCPRPGPTWWRRHNEPGLRPLRRAGPARRRDRAGDPPGRARRRYPGDGLHQAAPRTLGLSPGVAGGRRALGALHLPGDRAPGGLPLPGSRVRALDAGRPVARGRDRPPAARAPRAHHAAPPAGGGARAPAFHRWRGGLLGLRRRPHHRVPARRPAR